jgi:hypothetical protein
MTPTETEEATPSLNQENILNYFKDLLNDEYQQMAEAWGRMSNEEGFGQA